MKKFAWKISALSVLVAIFLDPSICLSVVGVCCIVLYDFAMPPFVYLFLCCKNSASETPFLQSACGLIFLSDVFLIPHLRISLQKPIFLARFKSCVHKLGFLSVFWMPFLIPFDKSFSKSHLACWIRISCFVYPSWVIFFTSPFDDLSLIGCQWFSALGLLLMFPTLWGILIWIFVEILLLHLRV